MSNIVPSVSSVMFVVLKKSIQYGVDWTRGLSWIFLINFRLVKYDDTLSSLAHVALDLQLCLIEKLCSSGYLPLKGNMSRGCYTIKARHRFTALMAHSGVHDNFTNAMKGFRENRRLSIHNYKII